MLIQAADKTRNLWIIFCVSFAAFMAALDSYIVNISLPSIASYFHIGINGVSRITIVYLLVLTSTLLIFGKMGDKIGFKKVFVGGYILFVIGSLLCGISSSLDMLLISRCIQALGGSMLYSIGPAIIPKFLPENERGKAFGILTTFGALGIAVGAPLGGFITGLFTWHWIFLINVPVGILAILFVIKILPDDSLEIDDKNKTHSFDILGSLLIFISMSLILYAINMGQELGWTSSIIICSIIGFVTSFSFFVWWEHKNKTPLLNLNLFKNTDFTFANLSNLMAFILFAGNNFLLPFYLVTIEGLNVTQAGLIIMIYSLVYMLVGPITGKLSDKIEPQTLCSFGMISAALSCLVFAYSLNSQNILFVVIYLIWLGFSYGLFISPNNNLIMGLAPLEEVGVASSVFKTITNLSLVMGVSIFGLIYSVTTGNSSLLNGSTNNNIIHSNTALLNGFHNAFLFGFVVSLLAFIFNHLIQTKVHERVLSN
ncbi:MAG: MFS transporter [Cyanobacteriota bacterium]